MPTDLVCHRPVPMRGTTPRAVFLGQAYYFCSKSCQLKFQAQPQRYAFAPAWLKREAAHRSKP